MTLAAPTADYTRYLGGKYSQVRSDNNLHVDSIAGSG